MPTSSSRLSYSDCFDYFDQALADPVGLAIGFEFEGDARQFRLRMNAARKIDREDNLLAYEGQPEHPLFGRSQYDELQLQYRKANGRHYVVIVRRVEPHEVLPLSELPEQIEFEREAVEWKAPTEVRKLTDRRF